MVCESKMTEGQSIVDRFKEVLAAQERLRTLLAQGRVYARIGANGALVLVGWTAEDRAGISDTCAYRALASTFEMRTAIARAEALAGRKIDQKQVVAGTHSHDGGKTWHPGH